MKFWEDMLALTLPTHPQHHSGTAMVQIPTHLIQLIKGLISSVLCYQWGNLKSVQGIRVEDPRYRGETLQQVRTCLSLIIQSAVNNANVC